MRWTRIVVVMVGLAVLAGLAPGIAAGRPDDGADRPMSVEWTRRTMDAYLAAVRDGGPVAGFFAEGAVVTLAGTGQEARGREAAAGAVLSLHDAAGAGRPVVARLVVGEGRAAAETDVVGAPAGAGAAVPYAVVYDLAHGEIIAVRIYGLGAPPWLLRPVAG